MQIVRIVRFAARRLRFDEHAPRVWLVAGQQLPIHRVGGGGTAGPCRNLLLRLRATVSIGAHAGPVRGGWLRSRPPRAAQRVEPSIYSGCTANRGAPVGPSVVRTCPTPIPAPLSAAHAPHYPQTRSPLVPFSCLLVQDHILHRAPPRGCGSPSSRLRTFQAALKLITPSQPPPAKPPVSPRMDAPCDHGAPGSILGGYGHD